MDFLFGLAISGIGQKAAGTGTLIGIGKEKAGKIWYRALTVYFTPFTNYFMARLAPFKQQKTCTLIVRLNLLIKLGLQ